MVDMESIGAWLGLDVSVGIVEDGDDNVVNWCVEGRGEIQVGKTEDGIELESELFLERPSKESTLMESFRFLDFFGFLEADFFGELEVVDVVEIAVAVVVLTCSTIESERGCE